MVLVDVCDVSSNNIRATFLTPGIFTLLQVGIQVYVDVSCYGIIRRHSSDLLFQPIDR